MPRTAEEILAHADELAKRFETDPDPDQIRDAGTLREIARAFERRARAEADVASAVATARADGHTWAAIGAMLGTSGEAARQRYGSPAQPAGPSRTGRRSPSRGTKAKDGLAAARGARSKATAAEIVRSTTSRRRSRSDV